MAYPRLGPTDYTRLLYRYVFGYSHLGNLLDCGTDRIVSAVREFKSLSLFEDGYHPFRHADHYKSATLFTVCRILKPQSVVETGVASGMSSTGILAALHLNGTGHLHSVDMPAAKYETDAGNIWVDESSAAGPGWRIPESLKERWTLHMGRSEEILPTLLSQIGPIDIFYHDSEHTQANMLFEMDLAWQHSHRGSIILVDNINWNDAFSTFVEGHRLDHCAIFPFFGVTKKPFV